MSDRAPGASDADRLSILAVTSEAPWPLDSGGHLRTYHLLRALSAHHDVDLVAPVPREQAESLARPLRAAGLVPHLVPMTEAGRGRVAWSAARAALSPRPFVMYARHDHRPVREMLRQRIAARSPDVLYLDHLDSFVYANDARGSVVVGDMHNVYSLLATRAARSQRHRAVRQYLRREAARLARVEATAARMADLITTVSETERQYFQALTDRPVGVVPNGVDVVHYASATIPRRSSPPVVLYLGAMSWPPNVDAARFLVSDVLPALRQRLPDARVQIVGRDPSGDVRALAAMPGVDVTGAVPDVAPYLAAAWMLAVPLDAGGGTRLKILEAFAAGLPVVSTPVGCEGIDAEPNVHLAVASRADFASAAIDLLVNEERAHSMAQRARSLVADRYDWRVVGETASALIGRAVAARRAAVRGAARI